MRLKISLLVTLLLFFLSCSQEVQTVELSNPGFGITASSIDAAAEGVDIPVLMKTDDIIKGIQFTLTWDPGVGQVIKPTLTAANPGFTISSSEGGRGEMKVLIFSMTGAVFNTTDPAIMTIPVRIINPDAPDFTLAFNNAIFAGPSATAYEIPVLHAKLKINR
ncbi:MAG: hypothetical protein HOB84_04080 [Candidatus Marinimicrobia bacterium]|jgi:hypothetical protein|nr:hypothetical protein [Candidatus Neomarinimicrobiota bacterium]MBT4361687.1 hypothetical protein [Candidatus Neomarinimicrobiota bacterium]MBT4713929.1 hypothetical protein [Candidatus Neomarinimicrobiota bacterium]MBT4946472.1 hypothetical protein [Candidatus Neomarinimicrobiota bacterium]MBT5269536.1 hypothetical protein [Candidatus Neomarinimicrobiota bacterium]